MKKLIVVILLLLSFSCVEKVIEQPENLIPKEKMVDILYDIAVFEAVKSTNNTILVSNDVEMMQLVYHNYKIDSTSFVESDLYYASTPLVYQTMYEEVEARIEKYRAEIEEERNKKNDSVRQQTKKRTDSIRLNQKDNIKKTSDTLP